MIQQVIRRSNWLVMAMLAVLAVAVLDLWPPMAPQSAHGLDNPAETRQEIIAEIRRTNERLDRLVAILESGKVKVTVANAEELRGPAAAAQPDKPAARSEQGQPEARITITPRQPAE